MRPTAALDITRLKIKDYARHAMPIANNNEDKDTRKKRREPPLTRRNKIKRGPFEAYLRRRSVTESVNVMCVESFKEELT